jgi:flagellar hook-associated protein 3 FlgL
MRVTFRTVHDGVRSANEASERFARAQEQVETGKRIHAPSDDPIAMRQVIDGRTEIAALDSYTRAGDSAASRLAAIDTTLGAMVDKLTAASVAASGARGSAVAPGTRAAMRWCRISTSPCRVPRCSPAPRHSPPPTRSSPARGPTRAIRRP